MNNIQYFMCNLLSIELSKTSKVMYKVFSSNMVYKIHVRVLFYLFEKHQLNGDSSLPKLFCLPAIIFYLTIKISLYTFAIISTLSDIHIQCLQYSIFTLKFRRKFIVIMDDTPLKYL